MSFFKNLEELDTTSIAALISRANRNTLIVALKESNESLRQKFLSTQSQQGAAMIAADIAALGPVRLKDVDIAQQEIINLARGIKTEGFISLASAANNQFVY